MSERAAFRERRRIKLIHRGFQIGLMVRLILVNAVVLAVFGALLYAFLRSEVESNLLSAHVTYRNVLTMLSPIVVTLSLLNVLLVSIVTSFVVLYASHRIAGPMYRFNEALRALGAKNLQTITRIRGGDQLEEVSESLTRLRDVLAADLSAAQREAAELHSQLSGAACPEESRKSLARLTAILRDYRT